MSNLEGQSLQQATCQDRKTSSVKRHTAVTMPWRIAGHIGGDNGLTFDVLRMMWVGINGQRCFIRHFFAVACLQNKTCFTARRCVGGNALGEAR